MDLGGFNKLKKLLVIMVLGLLLSSNAYAEYSPWNCTKISEKISKCSSKVTYSGGTMKVIYKGEIKNNKPDGRGKLTVFEAGVKFANAEGIWKTPGTFEEYAPHLIEGIKVLSDQTRYYKNEKVYKIISNNKVFEGVFHENSNLKEGTLIFEPSSNFKKYVGSLDKNGWFIKGTTYFKNGDK